MNVIEMLLQENSRRQVDRVVGMVENDVSLYKELVNVTLNNDPRLSLRSSWVLTHLHDKHPDLVAPYINRLVKASVGFCHTGIRRNVLRILANTPIPTQHQGELIDMCIHWCVSRKEPVAVKAHAMKILANIAMLEPDLKNEIIPLFEDLMHRGTPGIKAFGRKVLKKLGYSAAENE